MNLIKVAPPCGTVAPQGATPITWPADLTSGNRSAHNSRQNKLVRNVDKLPPTRPLPPSFTNIPESYVGEQTRIS